MIQFMAVVLVATVIWLAAYRLPFATPRARQRTRLAIASATGWQPRYVFPILGTFMYLALGIAAILVVGEQPWELLRWNVSAESAALTVLAAIGASALTAFTMSLLYTFSPRVNVPAAVSDVRWIQEILALPRRWRWVVPMVSAAVEEFFFRGVVLFGLLAAGAPIWAAIGFAGVVFTVGQIALTERGLQAVVLALSSAVLSLVCGLLSVVEGSVLPAILVHASFAGYYTNMSTRRAAGGTVAAIHTG